MSKKQVRVRCYGPIAYGKQYSSPWEDLFIMYKTGPGKSHYFWLTVVGMSDLLKELKTVQELNEEFSGAYVEEIKEFEDILKILSFQDFHVDKEFKNIYSNKDLIDKKESNRLISEFMKIKGFSNIHCRWKNPGFCITPM